ncbi:hypothetical protein [Catellatospora sichuanensis]|uniref:hypothetical protein n=1 Tax=Catellatospora sichuanensis TaxID=1969805 RepID=UPI0011842670|nr:hypothetical protein [Catellatospora sichuanensis]
MIIVLMNYIKKYTDGTITVRPEWVPRLNDIDGIADVLREIDTPSRRERGRTGPVLTLPPRRPGNSRPSADRSGTMISNHEDIGIGSFTCAFGDGRRAAVCRRYAAGIPASR